MGRCYDWECLSCDGKGHHDNYHMCEACDGTGVTSAILAVIKEIAAKEAKKIVARLAMAGEDA